MLYIYDDGNVQEMRTNGNRSPKGWNGTDILSVVYIILTAQMGRVEEDWNKWNSLAASPEDVSSASSRNVFYIIYTLGSGRYVQ